MDTDVTRAAGGMVEDRPGQTEAERQRLETDATQRMLDAITTSALVEEARRSKGGRTAALGIGLAPECRDCDSAIGPSAYLTALVAFGTENLRNDNQPIDLAWLEQTFCQPFGQLELGCQATDQQLRQVRLCIEVLRTYEASTVTPLDYLLAAYTTMLTQLGTSYDELRLARTADTTTRQALADRLGIDVSHLDALLLLPGDLSEAGLEQLFGLPDTTRTFPYTPPTPEMETWQAERLRQLWWDADWPATRPADARPLIDPDLVSESELATPEPGNLAYDIWVQRRDAILAKLAELEAMRTQEPTERAGFEKIVQFVLSAPASDLVGLDDARKRGEDIGQRLAELLLALAAFNELVVLYRVLLGGQSLLDAEWAAVYSILTQVWKRQQFPAWWDAEKATNALSLSPAWFQIPQPDPLIFPPPPPPPLPAWRSTLDEQIAWQSTLRSRIDQADQVRKALRTAAGTTEDLTLTILRDALVNALPSGGATLGEKAAWFTENFQIDATMIASQLTTRVGQATETLQGILWAVRTGQLEETHPMLELASATVFDTAWTWLGSYATWRASVLVTLYPENFLQPSLRTWQSPAFLQLVAATRAYRRLTPPQARAIAADYATYFRDICAPLIDAAAWARTRIGPVGDPLGEYRDLYYVIARGGITQTAYWSVYDSVTGSGYDLSSWAPIPGLEKAIAVLGATPYEVDARQRHLFVFAIVPEKTARKLVFTRYNLETRGWDSAPTEIDAPDSATNLTAVVEQRLYPGRTPPPPALAVRLANGTFYRGMLSVDGSGLDESGWTVWTDGPLANSRAIHALIAGTNDVYWVVTEDNKGKLRLAPKGGANTELDAFFVGVVNVTDIRGFLLYRSKATPTIVRYAPLDNPSTASQLGIGLVKRTAVVGGIDPETSAVLTAWSADLGADRCLLTLANNLLQPGQTNRIAPAVDGPFDITDRLDEPELTRRRAQIDADFERNKDASASIREYLAEAYYHVPIQIGLQLQASDQYIAALDWLRTVYDYTAPAGTQGVLAVGSSRAATGDARAWADWLRDPLNSHRVAAVRPELLTRYALLSLIGCFLRYGDAEFSRDTAESVPRARTLYMNALRLLVALEHLLDSSGALTNGVATLQADRANGAAPADDGSERRTVAGALQEQRALVDRHRSAALADSALAETVQAAARLAGGDGLRPDVAAAALPPVPVFCVPPNPVVESLRLHATVNLYKLRNGRNIAGVERQLDPYAPGNEVGSGMPVIGGGGELPVPAAGSMQPTPYRYAVLIERAKQLVQLAGQVEGTMLSAFERRDAEYYNLLRARQDLGLARAGVQLQDLRVREAQDSVGLAKLGQERAQIQVNYYQGLLDDGISDLERDSLILMTTSAALQVGSAAMSWMAAALPSSIGTGFPELASVSISPQGSALAMAGALSSLAGAASTTATILSTMASYERRAQEWKFQQSLAQQDVRIGQQEVTVAEDRVRIVGQDRNIAALQADNAAATAEYLATKFTNVDLYDWMSQVLEGVYRYFLQQATATAQVAAEQLAFERQARPPAVIQADYWEAPAGSATPASSGGSGDDRHGLTGSSRLLQDIYRLDQYAFETAQRKLQLTRTISLLRLSPIEFERLRRQGVMRFATPMELFDRDFPGHYLRLINRVRVSVMALIPAVDSIKATLTTTGTSRVVVGADDVFRTVVLNRAPELVALTSPRDASGLFELQQAQSEMLLPFEGTGVDTTWELSLPRATNLFDYESIADVLLTIEYTALNSYTYRSQVIKSLPSTLSSDRPFSFRQQFADQWYDLHNPDQTAEPMVVRFQTSRADFPPNLSDPRIQQLALYFSRASGVQTEVDVDHLYFTPTGGTQVGGGGRSIDGIISTLRGNASSWIPMIGKDVTGGWELAFPLLEKWLFEDDEIEDILFVVTYSARTAGWGV